jgi:hypothetical protein
LDPIYKLKTDTVEESDREDLGVMIVVLITMLVVGVVSYVVFEVRAVIKWAREVKYAMAAIQDDSDFDPSLKDHIIDSDELTLGKVLGQGAEGLVYKATYAGTAVAVKVANVCSLSAVPVEELLRESQKEAQTLQPLRHPVGAVSLACISCG